MISYCLKKPLSAEYSCPYRLRVSIEMARGGAFSNCQLMIVCAMAGDPQ
jgi:hypothetical protein